MVATTSVLCLVAAFTVAVTAIAQSPRNLAAWAVVLLAAALMLR